MRDLAAGELPFQKEGWREDGGAREGGPGAQDLGDGELPAMAKMPSSISGMTSEMH